MIRKARKLYEKGRVVVENFVLFFNSFLSYALLLVVMAGLMLSGCLIGIRWRKSKDQKAALEQK